MRMGASTPATAFERPAPLATKRLTSGLAARTLTVIGEPVT